MKKAMCLLVLSVFIMIISSCTPQTILTDKNSPQACCGDDFDIPPPPPPLPISG